jgi:8-oxo-dGTP pyrophosphatase MutT (NUDIX family)
LASHHGHTDRPNCHRLGLSGGYGHPVAEPSVTAIEVDERPSELVLAAGGLLMRPIGPESVEIAIVHRPIRDDWSFPKGKAESRETLTECALREVQEETGLGCRIVSFVGTTAYRDRKDRPKIVAYWAMTPEEGAFRTSQEVDEMRWVSLAEAAEALTYERDRDLLVTLQDPVAWILRQLPRSA